MLDTGENGPSKEIWLPASQNPRHTSTGNAGSEVRPEAHSAHGGVSSRYAKASRRLVSPLAPSDRLFAAARATQAAHEGSRAASRLAGGATSGAAGFQQPAGRPLVQLGRSLLRFHENDSVFSDRTCSNPEGYAVKLP